MDVYFRVALLCYTIERRSKALFSGLLQRYCHWQRKYIIFPNAKTAVKKPEIWRCSPPHQRGSTCSSWPTWPWWCPEWSRPDACGATWPARRLSPVLQREKKENTPWHNKISSVMRVGGDFLIQSFAWCFYLCYSSWGCMPTCTQKSINQVLFCSRWDACFSRTFILGWRYVTFLYFQWYYVCVLIHSQWNCLMLWLPNSSVFAFHWSHPILICNSHGSPASPTPCTSSRMCLSTRPIGRELSIGDLWYWRGSREDGKTINTPSLPPRVEWGREVKHHWYTDRAYVFTTKEPCLL